MDPKTVVLSRKAKAADVSVPKVTGKMQPGTYKYQANIAMAGRISR